ncbi:hypothetical protein N7465_004781 [Penicillium sp. CMV-2018d]|nr:hypothetical protein N7465_004781 [Penicillium sp. CMV-2018d]
MGYDLSVRGAILYVKTIGKSNIEIAEEFTITPSTVGRLWKRATDNGYQSFATISDTFVGNAPIPGRPKKQTE